MDRHYSAYVEWSEEDEEFVALCPEFPGASGTGAAPGDAVAELHDAIEALLETYRDQGLTIPEPRLHEEFSGQVRLRLPKELHRELAHAADKQGVSLNTLFVAYLAQGLGRTRTEERTLALVESVQAMVQHQMLTQVPQVTHITADSMYPVHDNSAGFGVSSMTNQ
jgi:predicted RNase H-like HicB family nuclease